MTRTAGRQGAGQEEAGAEGQLGRRILAHLRRWKRLDKSEVLFAISPIAGIRRARGHRPARRMGEDHQGGEAEGVTRHTLRHTRATWMAEAGVPLWEAAGFLG
jgi:integrase